MASALIGAGGVVLMVVAFYALGLTLGHGAFRARGNRLIARYKHPIPFWLNAAGISILVGIGFGLIVWALSGLESAIR